MLNIPFAIIVPAFKLAFIFEPKNIFCAVTDGIILNVEKLGYL
jgi:hypothetical protein